MMVVAVIVGLFLAGLSYVQSHT